MSLAALSTYQAIDLWIELEKAREGLANYGGDRAEIYMMRSIPYDNIAIEYARGNDVAGFGKELYDKMYGRAWQGIRELLILFAKERECEVLFSLRSDANDVGIGKDYTKTWIAPERIEGIPTTYRYYVRVREYEK